MNLSQISDSEILYRVIRKSYPDAFINGKATAAAFIDSNGTSVDRDGGREESEIITKLRDRFSKRDDYKTALKIGAGTCCEIGTYPNPVNNKKNEYHAEIWDSVDVIEISLVKAMQLADQCVEVIAGC